MDDKWAMARKIRAATLANADDKGKTASARAARAPMQAALVTGPIAKLEDNDDDAARARPTRRRTRPRPKRRPRAWAPNQWRPEDRVVLDAETLAMARDRARLQQQWRAHGASAISRAEREETFDDGLAPGADGQPVAAAPSRPRGPRGRQQRRRWRGVR